MIGAQVFQTKDAPRYITGTVICAIVFGIEFLLCLAWRFWYIHQNRRRARLVAESEMSREEQERQGRIYGEQDKTDFENVYFRYAL